MKINEIRPLESNFTEVLKKLVLNVEILYYYGKLPKKCPTVAIVGSRKNTSYGYEVAYNAAYEAAKAGAIVVSGLAYGIDSIAHRGALDAGGVTVAVLGTPIDQIYPREHTGLAREIVTKGGAVISEYGPSERAESGKEIKARFLQRNRLISGLADVVLIAEAADKSGSLNTATHALNQGKELMVVPGDVNREGSRGCNRLLAQGAMPYVETDDLLRILFPDRYKKIGKLKKGSRGRDNGVVIERELAKLAQILETELERKIVALILTGLQDGEEIIRRLEIDVAEFNQTITILEIKGVVKSLGMNKWMVRG